MTDEEAELRIWIEDYLRRSAPIRWVNWISKCPDPETRTELESVLFEDGFLRDLTDLKVADEVVRAILGVPSVMELVIADLAEEVNRVQKRRQ